MSLPKWVEEIDARRGRSINDVEGDKLHEALSIAWEALEKICDSIKGPPDNHYDVKAHRLPCLAEEALSRIKAIGGDK